MALLVLYVLLWLLCISGNFRRFRDVPQTFEMRAAVVWSEIILMTVSVNVKVKYFGCHTIITITLSIKNYFCKNLKVISCFIYQCILHYHLINGSFFTGPQKFVVRYEMPSKWKFFQSSACTKSYVQTASL